MNPFNADHPLRAPLFAALAAEVEEVPLDQFFADTGRRARVYADLARTLRPDVLVVDSGSGWDAEAVGWRRDWSRGFPPSLQFLGHMTNDPHPIRGETPIADLLRRVRAVVPEPTRLAVTVRGPTLYMAAGLSLPEATKITLAAARGAAEAGAGVVFVQEESGPEPPDGYARVLTPVWGALKFLRATGVLRARWSAQLPKGQFLPCVNDPTATEAPHALAVEPGEAPPAWHRAALLTHTTDLAGHVAARDLQEAVNRLG